MQYRAFFSYARADDKLANWLHRQLDGYRTPKVLSGQDGALGPVPAKLHPIFRDRTDLDARGLVDHRLQEALEHSECLVVLCTPTSAKSHWVNHECETFLKLGREERIFPVIGAGEPNSHDPETECFPPALRGKGLLAADLREIKKPNGRLVGDGRDGGRLKLIAGLLGVPLDQLVQRESRRQRQRILNSWFTAMAITSLGAVALWFLAQSNLQSTQIARQTTETLRQRLQEEQRQLDEDDRYRELAEEQRRLAGLNAESTNIQALVLKGNAIEASVERDAARKALARVFAERAWASIRRADHFSATRYALAGWRVAPQEQDEYRSALSLVLQNPKEGRLLRGHAAALNTAVFNRSGNRIVTASDDHTARIWVVAVEREAAVMRGHTSRVRTAAFSQDGSLIVTASEDRTARLWDVLSGRELGVMRGHTDSLNNAAFSPSGNQIATASDDGTTRIWSTADRRELAVLRGHDASVLTAAFSPDGTRLVTASADHTARLWDLATGRELYTLRGHKEGILGAVFNSSGTRVVTASVDKTARVWDVGSGRQAATLRGHKDLVLGAAFSRDGKRVVTASADGTARIWDSSNGREIAILSGHQDVVSGATFSPDETRIITTSWDRTARLWDAFSGREISVMRGHLEKVSGVHFSPNGLLIVTASADSTALIWDTSIEMQSIAELALTACTVFLNSTERHFNALEVAADPLIRHVWLLDGQSNDRDVCEGVPGIPAAPTPAN